MARAILDPITRIEGHLGADIELAAVGAYGAYGFAYTVGDDTRVYSTMYRGFENILKGRDPRDAIQITQRICGVCPVPHGMASTFAIENAMGYSPSGAANVGYSSGPNDVSRLVRHLTLGGEFMMSAITHFYALSALDLVQGPEMAPWTPFWADSYYDPALRATPTGAANDLSWSTGGAPLNIRTAVVTDYVLALRNRTAALDIGAIFGGRLPIASAFTAGGVTKIPTQQDIDDARQILTGSPAGTGTAGVKGFIENNYVPMTEIVGVLHGLADNTNNSWYAPLVGIGFQTTTPSGNSRGPYSCQQLLPSGLGIGSGCANFYAAGGFDSDNLGAVPSGRVFPRGVVTGATATSAGTLNSVDPAKIRESIKWARYDQGPSGAYQNMWPLDGVTYPDPASSGYTWHKAPRYDGKVVEVGPLARMWVKGVYDTTVLGLPASGSDGYCYGMSKTMTSHAFASPSGATSGLPLPALGSIPYNCGISLIDRHRARAREAELMASKMLVWLDELEDIIQEDDWDANPRYSVPDGGVVKPIAGLTATGIGMCEAPRGAVHHWIKIKDGKIDNYQLQAPTTWNCSGRDNINQPGPVEQALIGWPVLATTSGGKLVPVEALLVIHSFDPCIACSIHVIEPEDKKKMKELKANKGGVE